MFTSECDDVDLSFLANERNGDHFKADRLKPCPDEPVSLLPCRYRHRLGGEAAEGLQAVGYADLVLRLRVAGIKVFQVMNGGCNLPIFSRAKDPGGKIF